MNKKYLESIFYSTGGVAALVVILIAANFLLGSFNARVDLTQGSVYTLSQGTKSILGKLEAPVKIRLYFSQSSSAVPVGLKTFAKRVEDLLREFERAGGGKVIIEKLNPEPDSEAEDSAALDGIEGQLTNTQEKFYLGLAVSFLDQKAALPVLAPDREQLLEYDITRAVTRVASTAKPVVGIMSALPVLGRPLNPMLKQQPTEPWVLATELQNIFTVKKVELNAEKIPDDIKVLLVIHPR
ncbi:MAG: GldG family protein, partial [Burkholderiales bacterium]|nr:GldG family protein [Burkholderiales bacterium]